MTETDTALTGPAPAPAASELAAQRVVLVTGPSGAGRSTAIHVLEDLGFEAIDNLPLSLVPRLLDGPVRGVPLALGLDARNRDFSASGLIALIDSLVALPDIALETLYLDCAPDQILRRYSETRRRHPLAPEDDPLSGILAERNLMEPIRARADVLIDTTETTPHTLKAELNRFFSVAPADSMSVSVQSFSYKRGTPHGLDIMFDVRFLANPHWVAALRPLDGRDPRVQDHVKADPRFAEFMRRIEELLLFLLPAHREEGKSHLAIGIGCTGGQHRSVTIAEILSQSLAQAGWPVSKRHRELERRCSALPTPAAADRSGNGAV